MAASLNEHRSILSALQSRDPEAAERLVIYHAQSLRERFTVLFSEEALSEEAVDEPIVEVSAEVSIEVEDEVAL